MNLVEITPRASRRFHDVGRVIYAGDPNWIAPLDGEIEAVFDPRRNSAFERGEAVRWVLEDSGGRPVGRIAAFVDRAKIQRKDPPAGGVGFFECLDDPAAAARLFDASREWLASRGLQAMDGSGNFGENFVHQGVLVEGFMPQGYGMPYNKPYYGRLFEDYGFREYFRQFSYHIDLSRPFPERMVKFAEFLMTRPGFEFRPFRKRDLGRFVGDLVTVMNATWADYLEGFQPVGERDIEPVIRSAMAILVEDFIWFAYKDSRPVGVVVALPDVNQLLSRFDGRMNPWRALKLLLLKSGKTITRNRVIMAGVVPEFQNSGVIAPLFLQFVRAVHERPHYREIELSWVGDYNPRMRKIYEQIGAVPKKVHVTYRYLFDRNRPFIRFTNEGGNSALRKDALGKGREPAEPRSAST